jgi:LmbE family N-acetylglucosaminyl deacetylase
VRSAGDIVSALVDFPIVDLDQITGGETTLIVAPHPDDESLGCGGLIAESCARGCPPAVVIMTDGTASHPSSAMYPADRLRALRERETCDAVSILGLAPERVHFLRLRDSAMPVGGVLFGAAVAEIGKLVQMFRCKTIMAPWRYDPHCDHVTTQIMARSAAVNFNVSVFSYPVWGWLLPPEEMIPETIVEGWRIDIGSHLSNKRRAIASHKSQYSDLIKDDPHAFRLPRELLLKLERSYETFIRTLR